MNLYRLVTLKNVYQRADEAYIITELTGESIEDYITSKKLYFASSDLQYIFHLRFKTIQCSLKQRKVKRVDYKTNA